MNGTLQVLFSFAITWGIGLTPPLLVRFLIMRRSIAKWPAIAVTVLFWFCNLLIFISLGSESESHIALLVVAWVTYLILRKEGQPQGDSGVEYPGEQQVDHSAKVPWRPNGWIRIIIVVTALYCTSALLYGVGSYMSYPSGDASHWFTAGEKQSGEKQLGYNKYAGIDISDLRDRDEIDFLSAYDRIDPDAGELIKGVDTKQYESPSRPPDYYAFFLVIVAFPAVFWGTFILLLYGLRWLFYGLRWVVRWVAAGFQKA